MPDHSVVFQGRTVLCFGELRDDSNFDVVCDDENDDEYWCEGDPCGGSFATWEAVVAGLQPFYDSDILEISAI